jgi:hypothetical protein
VPSRVLVEEAIEERRGIRPRARARKVAAVVVANGCDQRDQRLSGAHAGFPVREPLLAFASGRPGSSEIAAEQREARIGRLPATRRRGNQLVAMSPPATSAREPSSGSVRRALLAEARDRWRRTNRSSPAETRERDHVHGAVDARSALEAL